tara:strand:- start:7781 stop:8692 length:912 start_codon:yes stop_codon:yes gene_type:complete
MKLFTVCLFVTAITIVACGSSVEIANDETPANQGVDPTLYSDDLFAFTKHDSDAVFQMDLKGRNIEAIKDFGNTSTQFVWENPIRIINNTCGGVSLEREQPIFLISPDGARLGQIDDSWEPNWSPDGQYVALACGRDDDNHVVVVSDTEHQGSSEGWSRTGKGSLSDRMEIYVLAPDGSEIKQLTGNEAGDWLPRWFPRTEEIDLSSFFKEVEWPEMLLVESNKDGNSEIYLHVTYGTDSWRVTDNESNEQSPAWSRDGKGIAFASDLRVKGFGISFLDGFRNVVTNTEQIGRPVPWGKVTWE